MPGSRLSKFFKKHTLRDASQTHRTTDSSNPGTRTNSHSSTPIAGAMVPRDPGITTSRSSTPPAGPSTTTGKTRKFNWKSLKEFAKISNMVGPFKAFADDLIECTHIYENISENQEGFKVLHNELEELFEELNNHLTPNAPPVMTVSVRNICDSIQVEIAWIKGKQDRSGLKRAIEVGGDAEDVLACYRRVRGHLQRLLFNINLSMWKAVDELAAESRLIKLSLAQSATYDSAQAFEAERGECTPGTRVAVFETISEWLNDPLSGYVYWMNGMAGTGKTTIAYSLCAQLAAKHRLAASFFCSRALPNCRNVNLIIPCVAYQLARFSRPFRFELQQVLEENPDAHTKLPHSQFDILISRPLGQVRDHWPSNSVVVIDALDECDNKRGTGVILDILLTKAHNLPLKFFLSSRPEPAIRDQMSKPIADQVSSRMVLHELDESTVRMDIRTYIEAALSGMPDPPSEQQIATLAERAGILFIYAATVLRYIAYDGFGQNPRARLDMVLNTSVPSISSKKYKRIDELYTTILKIALCDPELDTIEKEDRKLVLHTVVCVREPLTIPALSVLLKMDEHRVHAALRPNWSVLHVVESTKIVMPLHASFPDYIFDETRSQDYHCNQELHNRTLAQLCFECIKDTRPQFNICGLDSSYVLDCDIEDLDERIKSAISAGLFYACRYWAAPLTSGNDVSGTADRFECFLTNHLLLWIEVMNLKKSFDQCIQAIHAAKVWCRRLERATNIIDLIHDAWRFAMTVASNQVNQSTPHIYVSVLRLWPQENPLAKHYMARTKDMIKVTGASVRFQQPLLAKWPLGNSIRCGAFSPDGTRFAVGVSDAVRILDSFTGQDLIDPIQAHSFMVTAIQYSPDGTYITSANLDICIWDAQSGRLIHRLVREDMITMSILLLSLSPDNTRIASSSGDSIQTWNVYDNEVRCLPQLPSHSSVQTIEYSPDGIFLAGCIVNFPNYNGPEVKVWNAQNGEVISQFMMNGSSSHGPFNMFSGAPRAHCLIAWYPNSTRIMACGDSNIYVWDIQSTELIFGPLKVENKGLGMVPTGVSWDRNRVVMLSIESTDKRNSLHIFDTQTGQLVSGPLKLEGNRGPLSFAYFSHDKTRILASNSGQNAVCVFDAYSGQQELSRPSKFRLVGYSPDGTHIVSDMDATSIAIWNIQTRKMVLGPLTGHTRAISSVKYSHNGACILSCAHDSTIRIWDAQNGQSQMVFGPRRKSILSMPLNTLAGYSPDDASIICTWEGDDAAYIFSVHKKQTVLGPLRTDSIIYDVGYSPNGAILMASTAPVIYMWDAHTGRPLFNISRLSTDVQENFLGPPIKFSPDSTRIASGSFLGTGSTGVWDTREGQQVLGPLEWHPGSYGVGLLEYSPDGAHIVSTAFDEGIAYVWNAYTGELVFGPINDSDHPVDIERAVYSPDGTQIASVSVYGTIHVWDIQDISKSGSTIPISRRWGLRADGWIADGEQNLLMWIPPHLHKSLMRSRHRFAIGLEDYTQLDFEGANIGELWTRCYTPL